MNLIVTSLRGKSHLKKHLKISSVSSSLLPSQLSKVLGLVGKFLMMHQCIRLTKSQGNL